LVNTRFERARFLFYTSEEFGEDLVNA